LKFEKYTGDIVSSIRHGSICIFEAVKSIFT